jgi:hypothetical protein
MIRAGDESALFLLRALAVFDLTAEQPVCLREIARHCQTSFCTAWRWALKGLPAPDGQRVRLEALRVGGRWVSSWAALQRFAERTTPNLDGETAKAPRSASKRQRASERAGKQLERLGI